MLTSDLKPEERISPLTWNSLGKLVPLTEAELARQLAKAREAALENPPLPENRILSFRESLNLLLLDIAHMIDAVFKPPDHLPVVIAVQPPLIALVASVLILRMAWMVFVPLALLIIGFRLWVWFSIEKPRYSKARTS